jgi:hypothetical protein
MLYRDLVQFDPIESVIRLREASQRERARELVRTYVISERMSQRLCNVVLPQLDLDRPRDNKGVLIVGNYGTGKSHLMAVLAALAEFPDLVEQVSDADVRTAAAAIAGRFQVSRVEIGSVERGLREIILDQLEQSLEAWGVPFRFPAADEVSNNKDPIIAAVAAFQRTHPGQGILVVVDEMLDHLLTRDERQVILDLGFLRELGEVTSATAFRFIGGLQETLFDSPRFAFVADRLRRVRDRFEQILIAREDIAYVVAHRLLKKNDGQIAWVRHHLRRFEPLYDGLAERGQEFAELFPIHPAYIDTFREVFVAEKRQVLATFSKAIEERLDDEVPTDEPGVISFDHYWQVLQDDTALRSVRQVAEVEDKSRVLASKVRQNYGDKGLLPMALRIIDALSVYRLTTQDINVPVGLTPEGLRDGLFLYRQMPEQTAQFLLMQVQVALREIMRTVQGQYITRNPANGQYYLDVAKSVDFDEQIGTRGPMLPTDVLNRYYFDALRQALNLSDSTYTPNYRIWFYELPWGDRRVTRPGYLFLGLPNERCTAQPPRDFYVYCLPPFGATEWLDEEKDDEVILALRGTDDAFEALVRDFAAARDLQATSAQYRSEYAGKAEGYLADLVNWLRQNLITHLEVTFEGRTRPVRDVLAEARSSEADSIAALLNLVAGQLLEPTFAGAYPHYPAFRRAQVTITESARDLTATQALRAMAGMRRTGLAEAVLDGLRLLGPDGAIRPYDSPFAQRLLQRLNAKPEGQVVNRSEVVEVVAGGVDNPLEKEIDFHLEPEWLSVLLAALVYSGDIEITVNGKDINAGNIAEFGSMTARQVAAFRHYRRPPTLPVGRWADIFEALDLPAGLVRDENTREQAVRELQAKVGAGLRDVVDLDHRVTQGPRLWNMPLFTDNLAIQSQDGLVIGSDAPAVRFGQADVLPHLRAYRRLLDGLQPYNTVGKLRHLRVQPQDVADGAAGRAMAGRMSDLLRLLDQFQEPAAYLADAAPHLPEGHPLRGELIRAREALLEDLRRMGRAEAPVQPGTWASQLDALRERYVQAYAEEHRRLVLGPRADERRQRITRGEALGLVRALDQLRILPSHDLRAWQRDLQALRACPEFHEGVLANDPLCPHCRLSPANATGAGNAETALTELEERLDTILRDWRNAVVEALESDVARASRAAMTAAERHAIEAFLNQPEAMVLPQGFIEAANKALQGIESVAVSVGALVEALREGGLPCTPADLRARFTIFMQETLRGREEANTRLTLSEDRTLEASA